MDENKTNSFISEEETLVLTKNTGNKNSTEGISLEEIYVGFHEDSWEELEGEKG